ncbi:MAG: VacB/RNase II family 3'-5' exoribonuclease [Elusimicrobia bacterium]|nr:VacB/RNase II family 3'-5' exoribonuclease [Elusimicrobiota bacterium]
MARRGENLIEGKIQHRGHFAFLIAESEGGKDVYLSGKTLRLAMDGDRVAARIVGNRGGKLSGEIVRVITRGRTTMVGVLRRAGKFWALIPEGGAEGDALEVTGPAKGVTLIEGQLAALKIERWPTESRTAGGVIIEVLGSADDPKTRVRAVVASKDIPTEFPDDALEEAEALPLDPQPSDWAGRKVLFDLPVFTIDGADAKDFDDAVSIEEIPGGKWRLGVHIADVSHYVRRDSPLDKEAVRRGTSVYLPGRVIPMLPPKISDHLCSLRPDVPRLTLTCWMELDAHGAVHGVKVEETVIRSWRRFTYEEIQDVLDGKPVERVVPEVLKAVKRMGPLAKALTAERMRRGALDFSTTEYYVKCDASGTPVEVIKRPRLDSHRLIEEFMVAANEAVARHLSKARVPFLRRLHDVPDPDRLDVLQKELGQLGIKAPTSLVANPVKGLQGLLKAAVGHPFEETANIQVIRSLKLAMYSPDPGGHFGLASKDYCHFTSPIRRYPDLFVHRALKGIFHGKPREHSDGIDVAALATRCCERERGASEAERKAVDLARAQLLGRSVGQEFIGVVVNATNAGLFVALPESGAVGLLRGGNAPLGAKIKVKLTAVDPVAGRLDFEAVKDELPGQVRSSPWRRRPRR